MPLNKETKPNQFPLIWIKSMVKPETNVFFKGFDSFSKIFLVLYQKNKV